MLQIMMIFGSKIVVKSKFYHINCQSAIKMCSFFLNCKRTATSRYRETFGKFMAARAIKVSIVNLWFSQFLSCNRKHE